MDRNPEDSWGVVIPFAGAREPQASPHPGVRRRPHLERQSVEDLLTSLKGRRGRLEDRIALLSLAIDKLEIQVETKGRLELLPGQDVS